MLKLNGSVRPRAHDNWPASAVCFWCIVPTWLLRNQRSGFTHFEGHLLVSYFWASSFPTRLVSCSRGGLATDARAPNQRGDETFHFQIVIVCLCEYSICSPQLTQYSVTRIFNWTHETCVTFLIWYIMAWYGTHIGELVWHNVIQCNIIKVPLMVL